MIKKKKPVFIYSYYPALYYAETLDFGVMKASDLYHEDVEFIRANCKKVTNYCWNKPVYYEDGTIRRPPWAELIFPYEDDENDPEV